MVAAKEIKPLAKTGESKTEIKICHPSVCVGGAQPTSCVCPITPKK